MHKRLVIVTVLAFLTAIFVVLVRLEVISLTGMVPGGAGKNTVMIDPEKSYYYVDAKHGDDGNPGSETKPWKTLIKASTVKAEKRGTIVFFREGVYHDTLKPKHSGMQNAWIVFSAYPGEKAILDGKKSLETGISLSGGNYIQVKGFEILNFLQRGISIADKKGQNHIIVTKCKIHRISGDGIRIKYAKDIKIIDNKIYKTSGYGITDKGGSLGTVISGNDVSFPGIDCVYIESPLVTIENNYLHDNVNPIKPKEHADGIQIFLDPRKYPSPFDSHTVIRNNTIRLNVPDKEITFQSNSLMLENAANLQIYNNAVIGQGTSNTIDLKNCPNAKLFNNTFTGSRHQGVYVHANSTNCKIYNNLVYDVNGQSLLVADDSINGFSSDNNIYNSKDNPRIIKWNGDIITLDQFQNTTGLDKHSMAVTSNPGFTNYDKGDLRLDDRSPAINKGYGNNDHLLTYPSIDRGGRPRISKGMIDIGAFEHASTVK